MSDARKVVNCSYCGATYHIKFSEDLIAPQFCAFCSEALEQLQEEDDDGDLDYTDEEREVDKYN